MSDALPVISAHYAEIALKGRNRHMFIKRLKNNMFRALRGEPVRGINHVESRLLVRLEEAEARDRVVEKLQRVFGIQWLSDSTPVVRTDDHEVDLARVSETAVVLAARDAAGAASFRVDARRSDKSFPLDSQAVNTRVGADLQAALGLPVDLGGAEFTAHVLILQKEILVFTRKIPGGGGLPVGASGRVAVLLSGGIDSPVAAWMLMKRGCRPEFVHFYTGRTSEEASVDKIVRLAALLAGWAPRPMALNLVPAFPYEARAVGHVEDAYDMVLFRRYMVKTAARLANRENCQALVTGDSVGQVASQTLRNLRAIAPDLTLPVLRPLVGLDKVEITALSRRIGLYETSIEPYRDCCSIRSPRPVLNARAEDLLALSGEIDLDEAVEEAVRTTTRLKVGPEGVVQSAG
ncbi:tRNA 4-thiouridine(8) synthase ThiI [bacterium]|nr:tRNA 4-thiouridine(8) synthase ThiI [bacterium]